MADRNGEKPMKPLVFTHVQHTNGKEEWNQDRSQASAHQTEPLVDLNNPANKTREGSDFQTQESHFARRDKPVKLANELQTKNYIP